MKMSLSIKAEAARKRMGRSGSVQTRITRSPHEVRLAAASRMLARPTKPDLKLDDLRAKAAAARQQLHRG